MKSFEHPHPSYGFTQRSRIRKYLFIAVFLSLAAYASHVHWKDDRRLIQCQVELTQTQKSLAVRQLAAPEQVAAKVPIPVEPVKPPSPPTLPVPPIEQTGYALILPALPENKPVGLTSSSSSSSEEAELTKKRQNAFDKIYATNYWNTGESASGAGSTRAYTKNVRMLIDRAIRETKARTFLDAPCGDYNWQHLIPSMNNLIYTGVDIVPSLIWRHQRQYLGDVKRRFAHMDLVNDKLPETGTFDIVLTRDAVQHLPLADGVRVFKQIEESGAQYLITNFFPVSHNLDVGPGQYYQANVMIAPFNFPPPLYYILDGEPDAPKVHDGKHIGIWKLPVLGKGNGQSFQIDPRSQTEIVDAPQQ